MDNLISIPFTVLTQKDVFTKSNKMFEVLKSRYITGFSSSWRKARPFAVPTAIFSLVSQGNGGPYPALEARITLFSVMNTRLRLSLNVQNYISSNVKS